MTIGRVAKLLNIGGVEAEDGDNLRFASGDTVPADGSAGYVTGCVFVHTDGGAGTATYINEGSETSSTFAAVAGLTAAQEALLSATAGTAAASKAVILDALLNIAGLNDVGVDGTLTAAIADIANLVFSTEARTATADGLTTGTITDSGMLNFITVTSDDATKIIVLPTPTPGTVVILSVGATGYELRSDTPASVSINGGTGAGAESAIGANVCVIAICISATAWLAFELSSIGTPTATEAAA